MIREYLTGNSRGNYTIEAALMFSALILVLSSLILSLMLMYHKILLTETAYAAAQKAAGMLSGMRSGDEDLYRGAFPFFREEVAYSETVAGEAALKEKTAQLQAEVESGRLDAREKVFKTMQLAVCEELFRVGRKPETTTIACDYKDKLLSGDITVTITQEIKIPLGSLKRIYDGKDTVTLVGKGAAPLLRPAEYVSNIDLLMEYAGKLKATDAREKIGKWFK